VNPHPADLYPEVAALGSLAAALARLVRAPVPESDSLYHALVATTVPHRRGLEVSASHVERRWFIRGEDRDQGVGLIGGETTDLAQVARAAQAWHDGATLAELPEVAPFVRLNGRFEVPGGDPGQLVESEWQHLRKQSADAGWPEYFALISSAYAEVRLRSLYPYTSHWSLRFSTTTRPGLSDEIAVCLHPRHGEDYIVTMGYLGEELGRITSAAEAVALAVRHLPAGLSPVTLGGAARSR
jgi:hypothetical protein